MGLHQEKWSYCNIDWFSERFTCKLLQKSCQKTPVLADDQKQLYTVVSQALKVILNASYGVMGAEIFPLYCLPVAEATTAVGRYTILETIEKCKSVGIEVLYGDTDSLFLKAQRKNKFKE